MEYDLAVIGAGPGGYTAAIRASQLGMKTICIDKSVSPGGTCLNVGCIPSKALLESTELLARLQHQGAKMGVEAENATYSFPAMMQHKENTVKEITGSLAGLIKGNKVDYLVGSATIRGPQSIIVEGKEIQSKNILIATGSEAMALPFLPFDEKRIVSSTGALALKEVPKRLAVIGAGVIGVELASVYARLGSKVVLVEMLSEICGSLDKTIHGALLRSLKEQGLEFHLNTKLKQAKIGSAIELELEGEGAGTLQADVVLVSVGRKPFTQGLGLEKLDVAMTPKGHLIIDQKYCTSVPSIYAIGDVIEGPMLAHRASEEGMVFAELLAGRQEEIDYLLIPNIIYTHPEVASIGFTEKEARETGRTVQVGTSAIKANGRAKAAGESEGLVKLIFDKETDKLLGMHLFMPHASELISFGVMALKARATRKELAHLPFGHPTLSEAIKEACAYL